MKDGIKSSELYVALVAQVLALLQVYGILGAEESEAWLQLAAAVVAVVPAVAYIWSRTRLKQGEQ